MAIDTRPPNREQATEVWRDQLRQRRATSSAPVTVDRPGHIAADPSRRRFILRSFWTGLGVTIAAGLGLAVDFLYPRNVRGFGGPVPAGHVSDFPRGGAPQQFLSGRFLIANLDPSETRPGGSGGGAGLLALDWKCPHLGCAVPWKSDFNFDNDAGGWYRCPCHMSTYTRSGIRVHGPAPRSMDTMAVEIDEAGNITVQTGQISRGGPDNPERAIEHPLLPA
jgi:cytochrome b6-f complex iron-sulfur subunit